tara:strand:- start:22 stop:234 length:213 start_codon:yes stop_codon:yes gene_type:complete
MAQNSIMASIFYKTSKKMTKNDYKGKYFTFSPVIADVASLSLSTSLQGTVIMWVTEENVKKKHLSGPFQG